MPFPLSLASPPLLFLISDQFNLRDSSLLLSISLRVHGPRQGMMEAELAAQIYVRGFNFMPCWRFDGGGGHRRLRVDSETHASAIPLFKFSGCICFLAGFLCIVNPFRAPEPLPILIPSNFVSKNGFPVVKGLRASFVGVHDKLAS